MEKRPLNQEEIQELSQRMVKTFPHWLIIWDDLEPTEEIKAFVVQEILSLLGSNQEKVLDDEEIEYLTEYVDKYRKNIYLIISRLARDKQFRERLWIIPWRTELERLKKELQKVISNIRQQIN